MAADVVQLRPDVAACDSCGHLFERSALLSAVINVDATPAHGPIVLRFACCSGKCTASAFHAIAFIVDGST